MFTEKEDLGSRLTGSSRLLVLAIAEGMQERYDTLQIVMETVKLNQYLVVLQQI